MVGGFYRNGSIVIVGKVAYSIMELLYLVIQGGRLVHSCGNLVHFCSSSSNVIIIGRLYKTIHCLVDGEGCHLWSCSRGGTADCSVAAQSQSGRQRRALHKRPRHRRDLGYDGFQLSRIWDPHIPGFQAGCLNVGPRSCRRAVGKTGEMFLIVFIFARLISVLDRIFRSRFQVLKFNRNTVTADGFPLAPGIANPAPIFLT